MEGLLSWLRLLTLRAYLVKFYLSLSFAQIPFPSSGCTGNNIEIWHPSLFGCWILATESINPVASCTPGVFLRAAWCYRPQSLQVNERSVRQTSSTVVTGTAWIEALSSHLFLHNRKFCLLRWVTSTCWYHELIMNLSIIQEVKETTANWKNV